MTDPLANVTTFTYGTDPSGNPLLTNDLLTVTDANQQSGGPDYGTPPETLVWDARGRVTAVTDRLGKSTAIDYDGLNQSMGDGTTTVTDPESFENDYTFTGGALTDQVAWNSDTLTGASYSSGTATLDYSAKRNRWSERM